VLTILLGPFLALFPKRWRDSLPAVLTPNWRLATILSGLAESAASLFALVVWYSYSMTTWVARGMDSATNGDLPRQANEQEIGFAAVTIFAMHPLTWVIAYFAMEGVVRVLGAAISETIMGTFPLYLVDFVVAKVTGRAAASETAAPGALRSNVSSYADAVRQKVLMAKLPEVPDEIILKRSGIDETLEIRACRTKDDWVPPRIVRYGEVYYRLEETAKGSASRPFAYILRRLAAGVPGRSVIIYRPNPPPVEVKS
jgi:hypothetical protein